MSDVTALSPEPTPQVAPVLGTHAPAPTVRPAAPVPAHTVAKSDDKTQGNWFHRNRWFTHEPITNVGYQFVRSALAAIPYGPAMALGHHAFGLLSVKGQKAGYTEAGIQAFEKQGGVLGVEKLIASETETLGQEAAKAKYFMPGKTAALGRNAVRLANSPLNAAIQIGMGFTLFRFTGGLVKNLRDRVMNENNTAADTERETKDWAQTLATTAKTNWPAESTGTPIAALILGFMNGTFNQVATYGREADRLPGMKGYLTRVKEVWAGPKAKLLQNCGVWTLSYSLFFLMAENLFKDVQLRRGLWKGHPNSLKNGPDDSVGGPGAPDYITPERDAAKPKLNGTAEEGYKSADDEKAKDSYHTLKYPMLTGEPSLGRFVLRRVIPVGLGISAYAMLKRAGYVAVGGQMTPLTVSKAAELHGIGDHLKFFGKNAWKEGAATSMFGALWVATDAWGAKYDKIVHDIQTEHNAKNSHQIEDHSKTMTAHQSRKLGELHEKLNARETAQAAHVA